ncbi:ROK family protein [Streptomyces zingiberis]|uniref:ROK family protein n=1 Tax=Streptomyces zingiberis TaxID=2053010 RepID=UPI002893682B|nr:ROK family protein [Streptomyces zingiberis]
MPVDGAQEARPLVVADIGGTTLRIARWDPHTGNLSGVRRRPVSGITARPGLDARELQAGVVDQLSSELSDHLDAEASDAGIPAVGLSFAGPVTSDGLVTAAPTIWGEGGEPLPLGAVLGERLGRPVLVANDITAAVWRYAESEPEPFCLITVSSGIGNKVFRNGEVLVHPAGYGGELGHWRSDPSPGAARCDCGGRGHLGALASGRGMLSAARRAAGGDPAGFAGSLLAVHAKGRAHGITNEALAAAIRGGDPFATAVLRGGLRHLSSAIAAMFTTIGIVRYIVIGGFALAIGERYIELLGDELSQQGCFGMDPDGMRNMVRLGMTDDDHSLIGIGRMLTSGAFSGICPSTR